MTPTRSVVHLLNVFATRMEIDHAPADAIKAIKLFTGDRTIRRAEKRDYHGAQVRADEDRRTERQRTLFAMLPPGNAVDRLREAMLQRAYDLLWDGDPLGCDALIEFLPSADVDRMMNAWSSDFDGDAQKSKWHGGQDAP